MTAALTGGVVTNAVNIAAVRPEAMEALAPFVPLCEKLGRLAQGLGDGSVDRVSAEFRGRIAAHDTRLLGIAVLAGILSGNTEEPVNLVNAPQMAEERGIELVETKDASAEDFTELVTVRVGSGDGEVEVAGTGVGPRNEPYLVSVWGEGFYLPFADHIAVFRYADQPGMIGRVGTMFGEEGVNIVSAAVGAEQGGEQAVMALTTDAPVRGRDDRQDPRARGLRRRPLGRSLAATGRAARRALGWADAGRRPDQDRRSRGAPGPGAARPRGGRRRGPDRRPGRRDQLRRHDGPGRPLPGRAEDALRARLRGRGRGRDRGGGRDRLRRSATGSWPAPASAARPSWSRVPAEQVLPLPERLSFEQGAAFPVNYGTAYAALVLMGGLREGDRVLIHAAAGGVGISATQIARNVGAEIFGTASPAKHDAIRAQGVSTRSTTAARTSRPR